MDRLVDIKGNLHEGMAITEEEEGIYVHLAHLFHQKVCYDHMHWGADAKRCVELAGYFITNFRIATRNAPLEQLVQEAIHEIAPRAVEESAA